MPRNQGVISVYFDLVTKADLESRAHAAGLSISHYVKLLVLQALKREGA